VVVSATTASGTEGAAGSAAGVFGLSGLSSEEAARRLAAGRGNLAPPPAGRSFARILRDNARTPVHVALLVICALLLALGLFGDAVLTGGIVLGNIVVGVFQEARAKRQLDRIALLTRPQVAVVRDGRETQVGREQVVEGDVLLLRPGDEAVVDGPVLVSRGLGLDQALLTGESDVIEKHEGDGIVSGSFCVAGAGAFEAAKVGTETVANRITAQARETALVRTPLQHEVNLVIWAMSLVVIFLGAEVARSFWAASGDVSLSEAVRAAAVIVALVPQGLVVMVTVSYAMAAVRMIGSGVLVQHLNALESISHVDVLCMDKTGTITTNRLTLETLVPLGVDETRVRPSLAAFASSASYSNRTLDAVRTGLPSEPRAVREEVPFASVRKWSALIFDDPDARWLFLGAPDVLRPRLADDAHVADQVESWARKGFRVLLFAEASGPWSPQDAGAEPELPGALTALGLVILRDETRRDAAEAVGELAEAGIALKIISGDHPDTVKALATQAGIAAQGESITGAELDRLRPEELGRAAERASIFGRVSPDTKESLVRALQGAGHWVAMIGDGVNDVPAMKTAEVAVALRSGSNITRNIADLVLLRDEFTRLPAAFREGQRIRKGMEGIFRLFLTRTLSLTLVLLAVSLLNDPFPVSPRHTALIAMLTVGIPSLGLAVWARPARTGRTILLSAAQFVVPAALGITVIALVMFEFYWNGTGDLEEARTALTIASVLCGLLLVIFLEPPTPWWTGASPLSGDWRPTAMAVALLGLFIAIMSVPALRRFYELDLPDGWGFLVILMAVGGWTLAVRTYWRAGVPARLGTVRAGLRQRLARGASTRGR
jgi:cation-transporting ATPase E